jgi:arsenate reductase (thioredoxin)
MKKKVLVLGSDNAVFTPIMSELIKHLTFKKVDVVAAGLHHSKIHPLTAKVLLEMGIDISNFISKTINEFVHTQFDIVITLTEEARSNLNVLMACRTKIHKEFDDPSLTNGNEIQLQNAFREMRDEMNEWLNEFLSRHRLI